MGREWGGKGAAHCPPPARRAAHERDPRPAHRPHKRLGCDPLKRSPPPPPPRTHPQVFTPTPALAASTYKAQAAEAAALAAAIKARGAAVPEITVAPTVREGGEAERERERDPL